MLTITNKKEDSYFLPDDSKLARERLLQTLRQPGDLYLNCFGFTLQEAYDAIAENDKLGFKQSLLLDYTQAVGQYAQPKIKDLLSKTKNTSIILTSAGDKSSRPSSYWHWKGLVKMNPDQRMAPLCMDGSTNISISAFYQGNSMRFFNNKSWAKVFIDQHNENKNWALNNSKFNQPTAMSDVDNIAAFFKSLKDKIDSEFLI
jgi:hypothetical protein